MTKLLKKESLKFPMFEIESKLFLRDNEFQNLFLHEDDSILFFKSKKNAILYIEQAIYIDWSLNAYKIKKLSLNKQTGFFTFLFGSKFCLKYDLVKIDYDMSLSSFKYVYIERFKKCNKSGFSEEYINHVMQIFDIKELFF